MGHLRAREDRKKKTVELNLYVKLSQKSEDKDKRDEKREGSATHRIVESVEKDGQQDTEQ